MSAVGELWLYGLIGSEWDGVTAATVASDIKALGEISELRVYINSPGGNVFDAAAIYNILHRHPAKVLVYVDGMAFSAASVVAMAGDEIIMAENAMMMIHDPWTVAVGDESVMLETATRLEQVKRTIVATYATRSGMAPADIDAMMSEETWLSAAEAVATGLATKTASARKAAALALASGRICNAYSHMPAEANAYMHIGDSIVNDEKKMDETIEHEVVATESGGNEVAPQGASNDSAPSGAKNESAPSIAELAKPYIESFGADLGAKYFAAGLSMDDARLAYQASLIDRIGEQDEKIRDLETQLQAARVAAGHDIAPPFDPSDDADEDDVLPRLAEALGGDEERAERVLKLRLQRASNNN
jgi:ATP-dependent protease ClpP protease subunit